MRNKKRRLGILAALVIAGLGVVALLQEREHGTAPAGVAGIGGKLALEAGAPGLIVGATQGEALNSDATAQTGRPGRLNRSSESNHSNESIDSIRSTRADLFAEPAGLAPPATAAGAVPDATGGVPDATGGADRYADCAVVDERVGPVGADGRYERVRVVRTDMKYPLVRVVEKRVIRGEGRVISDQLSVISGGGRVGGRVISDPAVAKAVADRQLSVICGGKSWNEDEHRTSNIQQPPSPAASTGYGAPGPTQKEGASPTSMFDVGRSMLDVPSSDSTLLSQIAMVADHVTVQVKDGTSEAELAAFAQANGGSILRKLRVPGPGTYLVKLASVTVDTVPQAIITLGQAGGPAASVHSDGIVYASDTIPNDPRFAELWGMHNVYTNFAYIGPAQVYFGGGSSDASRLVYSPTTPPEGVRGLLYNCGLGKAGEFPAGVSGNIALIQRGGIGAGGNPMTFGEKVTNAKAAGAVAVVIYNNEAGGFLGNLGEGDWIPTVSVSDADGAQLLGLGNTMAIVMALPGVGDIDAPAAWELGTGSRDVLVAVIDTGIDYTHEDLAANMWVNPGETGVDANGNDKRTNGIDDDGNGFVDDWRGWDFSNDDNDPMDDHMHGTHCAGTLGGVGNNGIGVAGVCWNVSLVGLKFLSGSGSGTFSDGTEATYYATSIGAKLTSNSWGGGGDTASVSDPGDPMRQAILDAGAHGILFVAAAGNSAWNNDDPAMTFFPASYDCSNIISVAATDFGDNLAYFSNYGATTVDLGAPGVGIMSCIPGNGYRDLSGTSMACPHVAGAAALIASMAPAGWRDAEIKAHLLAHTDPISALTGKSVTGGRLNIGRAMISPTPLAKMTLAGVSDASPGGNGDDLCNPGETVKATVSVQNRSSVPLANVILTITGTDPYVTVVDGTEAIGDLPTLGSRETPDAFTLALAPGCPTPYEVSLDVEITADNGGPWSESLRFTVYTSSQIAGTVTLDGAPAAGVTIDYIGPMRGTRVTDANGAYLFGGVNGLYVVSARKTDWLTTASAFVTVPPSTNSVNFAFTTATVSGQTTDGLTGQPVAGVAISYGDALSGATTSDAGGLYSFTRVYGRPATLKLTASHPEYFDTTNSVTVPPTAAGVNFAMGRSDIAVDLTPIEVTATMGEVVTRTRTIGNQGISDLLWHINPPGRKKRAVTLNEVSPLAFDGSALLSVRTITLYSDLLKSDPLTGGFLDKVTVQDPGCGWRSGNWNGLDWDGSSMWVAHVHSDDDYNDMKTVMVHVVNPTTGVIVKTLELNLPGIQGILGGITLGDGCLWVLGGNQKDENFRHVWKLDASTGAVLADWPLPAEIAWPFSSYVGIWPAHEIEYVNGALYVASTPYDVMQDPPPDGGSKLYKLNPDTGQVIESFTIPGIEVYGLARAGTRDLWLLSLRIEGVYGYTDAHLLELGDEPWMRESPRSGTVAYLGSQTVTLTLDTVPAGLGVHESTYRIASNDPRKPDLEIPVRFTVLPNPTNHAPVIAEGASVSVTMSEEGQPTPFALTLHASDPDGDPLVWSVAAPAAHGTALAMAAGGSVAVTYQPTPDFFGADSFLVQVADNRGAAATIAVNVTILNVNDAPTVQVVADPSVGIAPLTVRFTATAADPDGDALNYLWDFGDGQTSTESQPTHTYTQVAVYPVTVTVTDPGGLSAQAALTVGVTDGTTRGQAYAWGYNDFGQLGNGTTASSSMPVPVPGLFGITTASVGSGHTTVQLADGNIYNWGTGWSGELGDGAFTSRLTPYPAPALAGGAKIVATGWQSFVIGADGTVRGCGANNNGQLGDGTTTDRGSPVSMLMADGTPVAQVTQFSVNQYHTVFLRDDGTVWGCGLNGQGHLGDGTWDTPRLHPVRAAIRAGGQPLDGVVKVVAALHWSLFLRGSDGTVWTSGRNSYGCLGNGDTQSQNQRFAVQVVLEGGAKLTNVVAMDGGYRHGVALKADGTVWSWGANINGQLGNPAYPGYKVYAVQTPITNVTAIAAGGYHTLALKADGTMWAWGGNAYGQLGVGTTEDGFSPVQVTGLAGVTAIEAGLHHNVALADASVNAAVTDVPAVTVPEGGTAVFHVKLREAPAADVTVAVSRVSGDSDLTVQSGASLLFTPANWDAWQAVTLAAAEDDLDAANGAASFVCKAPGLNSTGVTAREADNDTYLQVLAAPGGTTMANGWFIVPKNIPFSIAASPDAGNVFVRWTVLAGEATFGDANAATTTVTVTASEEGLYPGIAITSIRADFGSPANRSPVITTPAWAGPNGPTLPNGTTVHVAASDPDGDPLSYTWSRVSGPGAAGFGAATAPNCGVTFGAAGSYVLRVTVDDNRGGTATSDVTLSVTAMTNNDPELRMTGCDRNAVPGELVIRWQSASNRWYTVQASSNLVHGFNLILGTNIPATPPENVHTDNVSGVGCRFYRVTVE